MCTLTFYFFDLQKPTRGIRADVQHTILQHVFVLKVNYIVKFLQGDYSTLVLLLGKNENL